MSSSGPCSQNMTCLFLTGICVAAPAASSVACAFVPLTSSLFIRTTRGSQGTLDSCPSFKETAFGRTWFWGQAATLTPVAHFKPSTVSSFSLCGLQSAVWGLLRDQFISELAPLLVSVNDQYYNQTFVPRGLGLLASTPFRLGLLASSTYHNIQARKPQGNLSTSPGFLFPYAHNSFIDRQMPGTTAYISVGPLICLQAKSFPLGIFKATGAEIRSIRASQIESVQQMDQFLEAATVNCTV